MLELGPHTIRLLKEFGDHLSDCIYGNAMVGMLEILNDASSEKLTLRVRVLKSLVEVDVDKRWLEMIRLRKQEVERYVSTTKKIVHFLQFFNGKVDNYSVIIEAFPNQEQLRYKILSDLCVPRLEKELSFQLRLNSFDKEFCRKSSLACLAPFLLKS